MATGLSLRKAAAGGAIVGAALPLLNVSLQGEFAATGIAALALMTAGGALGGAVLFVFIALVGNVLLR